jgi:hypothetical protein
MELSDLQFNQYVTILLLGDATKTCLLPIWFKITPYPRVYSTHHIIEDTKIICNIWDVPISADQTTRAFFSNGIDKCIIVYDENEVHTKLDEFLSQRDLFAKDVDTIFLVLKSKTHDSYKAIKHQIKQHGFQVIMQDRNNLNTLKPLIPQTLEEIYSTRKQAFNVKLHKLIRF